MKKLICFLSLAALLLTGCERLDELDTRLSELDSRVTQLENKLELLNKEVSLISDLLSDKFFIQSVLTTEDPKGYKIVLVDGKGNTKEYAVYDGTDGQNGQDGEAPAIGIRMAEDGYYYWTLNGSWLLVDGQKVRANGVDGRDGRDGEDGVDGRDGQDGRDGEDGKDGQDGRDGEDGKDGVDGKDGLTPEFKIESGKWWVKLGDGEWVYAGEATTGVNSIIASIDTQSKPGVVIFHLTDGTSFEVPVASDQADKLRLVLDAAAFASIKAGETKSASYEVIVPKGVEYSLDSYEPEGWTVKITDPKNNKGTISITVPADRTTDGKVMFVLTGSDGSTFVQVVRIGVLPSGGSTPDNPDQPGTAETEFTVSSAAGSLQLPSDATQVKVTQGNWLTVSGTKVNYTENPDYDSRTGKLTYLSANTNFTATVIQAQKDAIVLSASSVEVEAAAGSKVTFVVKANVTVSASSNQSWLSVSPATKGLVDKNFTFTAQENTSTSTRSAKVTFTSGSLSQAVTVTQKGKSTDPSVPKAVTVAEFLAASVSADQWYQLTGTVSNITNTTYGDFDLTDDSGTVYVYGLCATRQDQNDKSFASLGIEEGDNITIATLRANYQGNPQAGGTPPAYLISINGRTPVTAYSEYGCYLGSLKRTYVQGTDQLCRSYSGDALAFVLLQPSAKEQVVVSGYKTSLSVGSPVSVTVNWIKNGASQHSGTYTMKVLKDEGGKVWMGDDAGKGFIIRK